MTFRPTKELETGYHVHNDEEEPRTEETKNY